MIDHLHIKNFLAFPELEVPELKLINLVAGKNGVGKTALLEALWIHHSEGKTPTIERLKKRRKDSLVNSNAPILKIVGNRKSVWPKFVINELLYEETQTGFELLKIEGDKILTDAYDWKGDFRTPQEGIFVYAQSGYSSLSELWDKVALSPAEEDVISIINGVINQEIERLSIFDTTIKVRLRGDDQPKNIESLGEGVRRILMLALAIVSSKNGLLLIDEIETHLHHSVIRKLWKIIFEYAIKWNIQVVATTHSQDAIREFWYEAATREEYQKIGQVLRLQVGREGKHEVIQFPFERLDAVMEMEMEIR
ncbi:MAG: AAA15 family ATPase/GTPase [Neolewinella sp.]|jgi:AAA15 family ATPase/GTPase